MVDLIPEYSHNIEQLVYSPDDHLRRDNIARDIARAVLLAPIHDPLALPSTETPFPASKARVLGVYGSWGAGKSFLLSQTIAYLLEANKDPQMRRSLIGDHAEALQNRCIVATFKAWEYEMEGDLAAGLAQSLSHLDNSFKGQNPRFFRPEEFQTMAMGLAGLLLEIGEAAVPAGGLLLRALQKIVENRLDDRGRDGKPKKEDKVAEVRPQMNGLVTKIITSAKNDPLNESPEEINYRLVIFIDDLDRCSPDNMVRLFEWMKNHLNAPNCVYVIALDHEAAARAIIGRYKEYLGESRDIAYGYRYLEKLVDMEWELEISPSVEFMALQKLTPGDHSMTLGDMARTLLGRDFAGLIYVNSLMQLRSLRNPRTMLKIATKYGQSVSLLTSTSGVQVIGKMKFGHEYLFWLALLTAMYYCLEPYQLGEFCRESGDIYQAFTGQMTQDDIDKRATALDQKRLDGPMLELCEYGARFFNESNLKWPGPDQLRFLLTVIRENTLPILS